MSKIKNTKLEVSSFALDRVQSVLDSSVDNKSYKTLVKKMSTLIQKNGYIGTLVFCYSKSQKNKEHKEVLKNIISWHKRNYKIKSIFDMQNINNDNFQEYIKAITGVKQNEYMLITREMMILFGWVKRFADGMIEDKKSNNGDANEG